jgi:hypothetical protein
MVPETSPPEVLQTLLKAAFEAGYSRGAVMSADAVLGSLAEAIGKMGDKAGD